jgi:hypothetical protein
MTAGMSLSSWQVVTRDDHAAPGDPQFLIDPSGRRIAIEKILDRRLVGSPQPSSPTRREVTVRAETGLFLLRLCAGVWEVIPGPAR